ncbi:hypothetical protein T4B_4065 [Trichinella pseudospiralis]|uniref:Uncharacterized protein n=1 Tax=Trichinella pseudospiralis TaxID=6337 RepID=A0A0V1H8N7_TRIPS|nr:hypothetical protein T4B_4065 [Trichinella pseudospiralis]
MSTFIRQNAAKIQKIRLVAPGLLSIRTCVHGYCRGLRSGDPVLLITFWSSEPESNQRPMDNLRMTYG